LLILPLATEAEPAGADVARAVAELWPRIVAFFVSVLVIGQFWVAHLRLFRVVTAATWRRWGSTCSSCSA
jgi:uncharacterized membrane protein